MNAGGMAGLCAWIVVTPQDMIKTRQQAHLGAKPLSIYKTTRLILAEGGMFKMFNSMHLILARGYLVSFVALPMYEMLKKSLCVNK